MTHKWGDDKMRQGGNRAELLSRPGRGNHGYGEVSERTRQLDDGVRIRVVIPLDLAEMIDVVAREEWMTAQEWIRTALRLQAVKDIAEIADAQGATFGDWLEARLAGLRASGKTREGLK